MKVNVITESDYAEILTQLLINVRICRWKLDKARENEWLDIIENFRTTGTYFGSKDSSKIKIIEG